MTPEKKKQLSHDLMATILMLALLVVITRLWPILLLMILGLFGYALRMLFRIGKQPVVVTPPQLQALPAPVTEQEVITVAFGLLQRRITQQVTAIYPQARWVWSEPGARERFAAGGPLLILLNSAGGYRKALVQVSDSKDVDTVKGILQARIDQMVNGGAWYPGPTEQWTNNSRVVSNGNYVMMVVHEDCDDIVSAFNALF